MYRLLRAPRVARAALGLAAAAALAACNLDETVEVQALDQVSPAALNDSTALPTFLAGAQSDFQVAYAGSNAGIGPEGQINMSGLFTDEFIQTESFPTRYQVDTREITRENITTYPIFLNLQRARASSERASAQYQKFNQATAGGRLDALNLGGFSYILLGENYCSGVPVSRLEDDFTTLTFGEPQTRDQIFQAGVAKFDTVLATTGATATAARLNLARVGRARALLNLARFADAGAAAAQVPADFVFVVQASENTARENNGVWSFSTNAGRWGVSDNEAGEGLPFVSQADARVQSRVRSTNSGRGFDGGPMREQLRYPTRTSPTVLADGVEAQLIVAEAALRAGNAATFLTTLNGLRSNTAVLAARGITAALPALADPGTQAGREDLLFRERAYWLFLTSHRLGDLRRLVRQYNRPAETVYPSGNYSSNGRSGVYGTDLSFPIPIEEGQNEKTPTTPERNALKGCLDRGA